MPSSDTQFKKGEHRSPATEFKTGEHAWREWQPHWEFHWLFTEYCLNGRSTGEIAKEISTTDGNVLYWLRKHEIPRRTVAEAREIKHWGLSGSANGMYGRTGPLATSWKGGVTPERQKFYQSDEWKAACRFVWQRDNQQCQRCKATSTEKKLHVHHIVSFAIKRLRADPTNLILLCAGCHRWVHSKKNKDKEFIKYETGEIRGGGDKHDLPRTRIGLS